MTVSLALLVCEHLPAEEPAAELRAIAQRLAQIADEVQPSSEAATWLKDPESVDRSDWSRLGSIHVNYTGTIPPRSGWVKAPVRDGFTREKIVFESGRRTAVQYHTSPPSYFRDHAYRQIEIRPARPFAPGDGESGVEWGMRIYNTVNLLIEDIWVHGINSNSGEGHGLYIDPAGPFTIRNARIEDCGGQAIQVMNRQWGSIYGPDKPPTNLPMKPGESKIQHVVVRNVGWNPARGAFALTVGGLGPEQDLTIDDLDLEVAWDQPQTRSGRKCRSAGGITVWQGDAPGFPAGARFARHVRLRDSRITLTEPRQPLLLVNNVESLLIEGCHFAGGEIHLDVSGPASGRIEIRNCTGDVPVYVAGKKVGLVSQGFKR